MPGKPARAVGIILIFCWWIALLLAVGEAAARKFDAVLAREHSQPFNLGEPEWAARAYRPSPALGWEHVPNSAGFNSHGFLGPDYPLKKSPGTFRVLLLGDSLAAAYGPYLQRELEDKPVAEGAMELWNLGVGGYNLAQYALTLKHKGPALDPDRVLLFICLNDLPADIPVIYKDGDSFLALRQSMPEPESLPLGGLLWERSALYRALMIDRLMAREPAAPDLGKAALARLLEIKDYCAERGIPLTAFVFPYLKPLSGYKGNELQDYRTILEQLRLSGIPHFDLHGRLDDGTLRLRNHPSDQLHFSAEGRARAMRAVRELL